MRALVLLALLFGSSIASAQNYPVVTSATRKLDERALTHLFAGNLDSAIDLFDQWLIANPRDNTSWYNLACAHAKSGHATQAAQCLQNAVRTGFTSRSTIAEDPDLATLRPTPAFAQSMAIMDSLIAVNTVANMERRYLPSRSVGTYRVLLPPDYNTSKRTYNYCLLIPGSGWSEAQSAKMAEDFGRDGIIFLIPRPQYPNFASSQEQGNNIFFASWPDDQPGPGSLYDSVTMGYINFLADIVGDARSAYRISPGAGVVIGQSQGASFADLFALYHPELVKAYVAHAAPYPKKNFLIDARFDAMKAKNVKATLFHSVEDTNIPIDHSQRMKKAFAEHGINATLIETKGGHAPAPETRVKIREWLNEYRK